MRRVGLTDLDLAARYLGAFPPGDRAARAASLLEAAHSADKLRKRLWRALPGYGDGSLATEALMRLPGGSGRRRRACMECMGLMIMAICDWRTARQPPDRQP